MLVILCFDCLCGVFCLSTNSFSFKCFLFDIQCFSPRTFPLYNFSGVSFFLSGLFPLTYFYTSTFPFTDISPSNSLPSGYLPTWKLPFNLLPYDFFPSRHICCVLLHIPLRCFPSRNLLSLHLTSSSASLK